MSRPIDNFKLPTVTPAIAWTSIAILQFLIVTATVVKYRSWFLYTAILGALWQCIGLIARLDFARHGNWSMYILSQISLFLATSHFILTVVSMYNRLVWWVTPEKSRNFRTLFYPPRFLITFFCLLIVGSLFIQLLGTIMWIGGLESSESVSMVKLWDSLYSGSQLLCGGLIWQLTFMAIFFLLAIRLFAISRRWEGSSLAIDEGKWRTSFGLISTLAGILTIQIVLRLMKYGPTGLDSRRLVEYNFTQLMDLREEWYFWLSETIPFLLFLAPLTLPTPIHPASILPDRYIGLTLNSAELSLPSRRSRIRSGINRLSTSKSMYLPPQQMASTYGGPAVNTVGIRYSYNPLNPQNQPRTSNVPSTCASTRVSTHISTRISTQPAAAPIPFHSSKAPILEPPNLQIPRRSLPPPAYDLQRPVLSINTNVGPGARISRNSNIGPIATQARNSQKVERYA